MPSLQRTIRLGMGIILTMPDQMSPVFESGVQDPVEAASASRGQKIKLLGPFCVQGLIRELLERENRSIQLVLI